MRFYQFFAVFLVVVLVSCVFGYFHNQVSYFISNEVFEHLFFPEFGIPNREEANQYFSAGIIGVIYSLSFGGILGLIYGICVFVARSNWKKSRIAIFINFAITFLASLLGIIYGYLFVENLKFMEFDFLMNLKNPTRFSAALWMHNFSYFGGFVGCLIANGYLIYNRNIKF